MRQLKSVASNAVIGPMPLIPLLIASQTVLVPIPTEVTSPTPVTTTLRFKRDSKKFAALGETRGARLSSSTRYSRWHSSRSRSSRRLHPEYRGRTPPRTPSPARRYQASRRQDHRQSSRWDRLEIHPPPV